MEDRLFQISKNHATNDSDKIILNNEIESCNLFSNFDKNEECEGLLWIINI